MSPCSDFLMDTAPGVFTRSGGYLLMGRQGASWQLCPVGAGHWALPRWAWDRGPEAPFTLGPCASASLCRRAEWYLLIPWDRADCVPVGDKGRGAGEQHAGGSLWPAARGQRSLSSSSSPQEPLWTPGLWPCITFSAGLTRPRGLLASLDGKTQGPVEKRRWIWPGLGGMAPAGLWGAAQTPTWASLVLPVHTLRTPGCAGLRPARLERLMIGQEPRQHSEVSGGCLLLFLLPAAPLGLGAGSGEGRVRRGCWALGPF